MITPYRISKSDMIASEGLAIRPLEQQNGGWLFERVLQPNIVEWLSHEDLISLLKRPDTKFHPNYFDLAIQKARAESNVTTINELPVKARALVLFRKAVCDALLQLRTSAEFSRTHAGFERIKDKLGRLVRKLLGEGEYSSGSKKPATTITMRKLPESRAALDWLRAYEKAGYSALALIPKTFRSGNRKPRWCPRSEALMNQVIEIYASTQRPTKVQAVADTRALFESENQRREKAGLALLVIPSAATIRRRLNVADPYYVYAKRHGTSAANKHFTLFENGPDVVMPLERVEISSERQAWYIWDLVRHQLKELGVTFILLDEAQELASRGTKHELGSVASMLKTLMTDPEWPVGIILSGTLELEGILNHDPQLARRMKTVRFNSLSPVSDAENAVDLIGGYCDVAEISAHKSTQEQAMGERLIHAAANQFGLVIELTIAALEQAFLEASSTLRREHFAKAYHCRSACDDTLNPFIIPDFYRIDPRQVFPEAET